MLAMRKSILEIIPQAEEVVSYGMPAFEFNGNIVAGILHAKNHASYYPFSGSVLQLFPKELKNFSHTKSAIHVPIVFICWHCLALASWAVPTSLGL